jgi:hypothetical protein
VNVLDVVLHLFVASAPLTEQFSHSGLRKDVTIFKEYSNEQRTAHHLFISESLLEQTVKKDVQLNTEAFD